MLQLRLHHELALASQVEISRQERLPGSLRKKDPQILVPQPPRSDCLVSPSWSPLPDDSVLFVCLLLLATSLCAA